MHVMLLAVFFLLLRAVLSRDITIHVIPHSHMDPMWLFRPDEYAQRADLIMDGVLRELLHHRHKTFTWEGVYFLHHFLLHHGSENTCNRWSQKVSNKCMTMHEVLLFLINRKQFEVVGGTYTAFDEALTNSYASLNNIITGRTLLQHFNITPPSIAWFVDSFGHAASTSALLLGFDYSHQVLNRLPYQIKHQIQTNGPLFFSFGASATSSSFQFTAESTSHSNIATYVLPHHYSSPYHIRLESDISDIDATAYCTQLLQYFLHLPLTTDHVMLLLGDDFAYRKTEKAYRSVDKIIKHLNSLSNSLRTAHSLHMKYSTPSSFFASLPQPSVAATGNLLPYSDNIANDWTGYYGSRPGVKLQIMVFQRRLKVLELVIIGALLNRDISDVSFYFNVLQEWHEFLSLAYHHDSITGTSRRSVIADFIINLRHHLQDMDIVLQKLLNIQHKAQLLSGNNFNETIAVPQAAATVFIMNPHQHNSLPAHISLDVGCDTRISVECEGMCQLLTDYDFSEHICSQQEQDTPLQRSRFVRALYHELAPFAIESFVISRQSQPQTLKGRLDDESSVETAMRAILHHTVRVSFHNMCLHLTS